MSLLEDYVEHFPVKLTIRLTEHLVIYRMGRVFAMEEEKERLAAIDSFVTSLELWTATDASIEGLLDYKNASFIPVIPLVLKEYKSSFGDAKMEGWIGSGGRVYSVSSLSLIVGFRI